MICGVRWESVDRALDPRSSAPSPSHENCLTIERELCVRLKLEIRADERMKRACPWANQVSNARELGSRTMREMARAENGKRLARWWDLLCEVPSTSWSQKEGGREREIRR